jgi:hypothetical protein
MKTLTDIKQDMSELYDALKVGAVDIKVAGELANISGKFLKAEQLELAKEIFMSNRYRTLTIDSE